MRIALATLLVVVGAAAPAAAFPAGNQFDSDALATDGGGGIAFTGSPRFTGHTCAVCHTNAPLQVGLKLDANHPEIFTSGWVTSMQYVIEVDLLNAHEALPFKQLGDNCGFNVNPYVPCSDDGFAVEMDDPSDRPTGTFAAFDGSANACAVGSAFVAGADAYVLKDGTAVVHSGAHHGQTSWKFCWTAPSSNVGTINIYAAVVDGGSGSGSAFPDTTYGDDLFAGVLAIPQQGSPPPPPESGGCSSGGTPGGLLVIAIVVGLLLRRRDVRAAALIAALAAGCTHVRATQREVLARKNMVFGPDGLEDELDLHMQEAREGSAGGYGSAGGGCGCN
jgi:MYXO-CTERM domain-containing protein